MRLGANKGNALVFAALGKGLVLRQETIAGMDGLGAGLAGGLDDAVGQQVGLSAGGCANVHGLVGQLHMARFLVRIGVDRNGLDAHGAGSGDHTACNLAAISNQDFAEHGLSSLG